MQTQYPHHVQEAKRSGVVHGSRAYRATRRLAQISRTGSHRARQLRSLRRLALAIALGTSLLSACGGSDTESPSAPSQMPNPAPAPAPSPAPAPAPAPAPPSTTPSFTSVTLIGQIASAQLDTPVTLGHVFKPGQIPAGSSVLARWADGTDVPMQVDAKAYHADGSLRHAVLTITLPSLAANASRVLNLSTAAPSATTHPVTLSSVLAGGYETQVTLNLGGVNYAASARQALAGSDVKAWLSGDQVSEWIAGAPLRSGAGSTHPHLMAYFHVRAYAGAAKIRTDLVIENNRALVANPGNIAYAATVRVPGKADYNVSLTHYARTRWHKRFWFGTEPHVYAKLDKTYLQDTKAIPKYETLQPTEAHLDSVRRTAEPMSNADQEDNMDDTGFQPGIGPLSQWDSLYAVSTDVRAFDSMLANADGGSAYSVHIRDERTGLPISIDDFPNTSLADPRASSPALPEGGRSIYSEGQWSSHQPSIGYLPYLVTGDYFYLEEAQFWSAYNLIWPNHAGDRGGNKGWWYRGSIRGQAWAYRSLAQAAYITPDAHPLKAYFNDKLSSNLKHDIALYVSPGGPDKTNLGTMRPYEGNQEYRFFDYFMSWVVQYMVDLGFNEAVPFRDYKVKFPIGIMGDDASNGYCFQAAALYIWTVGPSQTEYYPDFKTMFKANVPGYTNQGCATSAMSTLLGNTFNQAQAMGTNPNAMVGDQTATGYYFANLQPALASAYDSGVAGGRQAWQRAHASGLHPDYRNTPIWAVVPRTLPP